MSGVQLVNVRTKTGQRLGVKVAAGLLDAAAVNAALGFKAPETMEDLLEGGQGALDELRCMNAAAAHRPDLCLSEAELELAPVVPKPQKIICVGLNYGKHAAEVNLAASSSPILFSKFANSLVGSGEAVALPAEAVQIDYEAELAIVMGRRARNVPAAEALHYVLGYCNANDLSARDLQLRTSQWLLGKTPDGFCPVGPYLVTADEVPNPDQLAIRCWVNGELRQDSSTADMIFSCTELIHYISRYITLEPGDLILTGTPPGVVLGMPEEKRAANWLKAGDEVTVEVEGLGRLVTRLTSSGC